MTIKTKSLKHLVLKELKRNKPLYQDVPFPREMFVPFGLVSLIGGLGSGKTTFLIKMLQLYETTKTFDKIFYYSPTIGFEEKREYLPECTEVFEEFTFDLFEKHKDFIRKEIEDYKIFLKYMEIYNKAMRGQHITHAEMIILESNDGEPMESEYKHMPCFCMVFDDLQSNRLIYSPNMKTGVSQFFLNTRHFNTMCIFSCQTFKNAIPKQLKSNIAVYILFRCKALKQQKDIAEDLVGVCPVETFIKCWNFACEVKYSAFVMDRNADEKEMFRRNFDCQIMLDDKDLNPHEEG